MAHTEKDPTLACLLNSVGHIMEEKYMSGLSHRFIRYMVDRDHKHAYLYLSMSYGVACDGVLGEVSTWLLKLQISTLMQRLTEYDRGLVENKDFLPGHLESLFYHHALSENGLRWKWRQMRLKSTLVGGNNDGEGTHGDWETFGAHFEGVERSIVAFDEMKAGVLYYPLDGTFPLVDLYYLDESEKNAIVGIQATKLKKHDKPVSTYEKFYSKIGANPEVTKLKLVYFTLPSRLPEYDKESNLDGMFFTSTRSTPGEKLNEWKKRVSFHVLVPPKNFQAHISEGE